MSSFVLTALVSFLFGMLPLFAQPSSENVGVVKLLAINTFGEPLKAAKVAIYRRDDSGKALMSVSRRADIRLPFGEYLFEATASLHQRQIREVSVSRPLQGVVLALAFLDTSTAETLYPPVTGQCEGVVPEEPLWSRLVSAYGAYVGDDIVAQDGSFSTPEVPWGEYRIVVLRRSGTAQVVSFSHTVTSEPIRIALTQ